MANLRHSKSKPTIMVVDDNQDLVEIVRLTLESKGFKVSCAYNGQELLDSLDKQKPDLILLDIMMPRMDGLQVLKRVKGNPATASIPVILLTAKVHHEDEQLGYELGTDNYIKKPFDSTQLVTSINRLLESSNTQHSLPIASA